MKKVEVVAAVITFNNKFLCVQRGESKFDYISKKFEFPGGKIEYGESKTNALKREILEELNVEIEIINELITINHLYPDFELTMHSYLCTINSIQLELKEHLDFKWLNLDELHVLDWAAADVPIVDALLNKRNE
jgi:8-oxo-dGTP diphosphatase